MTKVSSFFARRSGIIVAGLVIGGLAATLQNADLFSGRSNPPNMGVCVACFTRDIAGSLGCTVPRPSNTCGPKSPPFAWGPYRCPGLRRVSPRTGSSPIVRFILGMFAMIGALVFLGCPWRAMLRLAGGDWNAILGLAGLVAGIGLGVLLLRGGFSLGRAYPARAVAGLAMPVLMGVLLLLAIFYPVFGEAGQAALFRSAKGPGAMAAPIVVSILVGLVIGFLAQRTRFCTVGAFRDLLLMRDFHLLSGIIAFLVAAFALNLVYGQFKPGFTLGLDSDGKPIQQFAAHSTHWLNFAGMLLAGLSFTLAGGCPGRQVFLSGEGDGDAAVFVLGMLTGAAVSHNFNWWGRRTSPRTWW